MVQPEVGVDNLQGALTASTTVAAQFARVGRTLPWTEPPPAAPATAPPGDAEQHLCVGDEDAERMSVRVGEDPQRFFGIMGAVEAGGASERDDALVDGSELRQVSNHQVEVELLGNVLLWPGRMREFCDLLEREQRRPVRQPQVEPVPPGFVVLI